MWSASSRKGMRLSGARFFEMSPSIGMVKDIPSSLSASHQPTIAPDARSKRLSCQRQLMIPLSSTRLADLVGPVALGVWSKSGSFRCGQALLKAKTLPPSSITRHGGREIRAP
jgi:hypothetical protein